MSKFKNYVYRIVKRIPYGKVASYGQVALYAGVPRAARQVGWILNQSEGKISIPWWRIINNSGRISIKGTKFYDAKMQKKLLQSEGVLVNKNFIVNIEKYRFRPDDGFFKNVTLDKKYKKYLEKISKKFPF